ncbi:bpX5 domain-containing protein [Streptomyces sp. NPDC054840]
MTAAPPSPPAPPPPVPLRWERREPPLPTVAVLAVGDAVPGLAAAALERIRDGARLGVLADDGPSLPAADRVLLVLGAEADLPWADGVRYLGRDAGLLVPTTARPVPAAALWRRAVGAAEGRLCVLVPGRALVADPPAPVTSPDALDALIRPEGPGPHGAGGGAR